VRIGCRENQPQGTIKAGYKVLFTHLSSFLHENNVVCKTATTRISHEAWRCEVTLPSFTADQKTFVKTRYIAVGSTKRTTECRAFKEVLNDLQSKGYMPPGSFGG
jgi:hypothetical protein